MISFSESVSLGLSAFTSLSGCAYLWVSPSLSSPCFCFSLYLHFWVFLPLSSQFWVYPLLSVPVSGSPPVWVCLPLTVFVGLSMYLSTSGIQGPLGPDSISGSSCFCCSLSLSLLSLPVCVSACQGSISFLLLFTSLPWRGGGSVASKDSWLAVVQSLPRPIRGEHPLHSGSWSSRRSRADESAVFGWTSRLLHPVGVAAPEVGLVGAAECHDLPSLSRS